MDLSYCRPFFPSLDIYVNYPSVNCLHNHLNDLQCLWFSFKTQFALYFLHFNSYYLSFLFYVQKWQYIMTFFIIFLFISPKLSRQQYIILYSMWYLFFRYFFNQKEKSLFFRHTNLSLLSTKLIQKSLTSI